MTVWPFLLGEPLRTKRERQMSGLPPLTEDELRFFPEADLSRQGRFERALNRRHPRPPARRGDGALLPVETAPASATVPARISGRAA